MVLTRCASSELQFGALREVASRERQHIAESLVGSSRCALLHVLLGDQAPDSARMEGSAIIDKPGEC